MATALVPLERIQAGIEATAGTLVAADEVIVAEDGGEWAGEIDWQAIDEPQGVLALTDDIAVRKGSTLSYTHSLDCEQILLPLLTGLKGAVTATGVGPYTWTFTPGLSTLETLDAATFEVSYYDGTTRHIEREFGYGTCSQISLDVTMNDVAKLSAEYFGRHTQSSTFTPALTAPTRTLLPGNLFTCYIDTTWAGLGGSQVTGTVRSAQMTLNTGAGPDYTADGRTDLDFTQLMRGMITGTLDLTLEVNATYGTELTAFEAGTLRFIRLTAASGTSSFTFDCAGRYIDSPSYSRDDQLRLVDMSIEFRHDPTSGNIVSFEIVNDLATFS